MDDKKQSEYIFALCQGCLSSDRQLTCVTDETKALFMKLRNDFKQCEGETKNLQLCWECIALLNKMKHFQARIKTAQCRLMRYLHTLYKDDIHTLSPLTKTKQTNQYDYKHKFIHSQEELDLISEVKDLPDEKELISDEKELIPDEKKLIPDEKELTLEKSEREHEYLVFDIKEENYDNSIKEEYEHIRDDNDFDFYESDLKQEAQENFRTATKKHYKKHPQQSIKTYERFATITKNNSLFTRKVNTHSETVYLSEKEIETVLERDRRNVNYKRMPFKCEICVLGYKRRLDLLRHRTLNHDNTEFPSPCSACKSQIHSRNQLEEHWQNYHTSMLRCNLCAELCRSLGEMRKHLNRSHTKTYTCNHCQQECRSLREFSNHYKRAHERVVCDYCNSSFSSKRRLEAHIKRNHLPAYCTICNRSYRTYHVFENHLRTDHPELISSDTRKEMCYCVECDKQYPSIYKYRRHLQQSARHTPRKIVRVPCPDCDKIFSRTSYMNNHYRLMHMKQSKHYCDLCNKYFANGYGVRKHIQYVHQKIPMPKDKICDLCGRGFSTNRILTNHRRTHTGERPFKCPHCPASFAQKTAMNSHQKTQHKNVIMNIMPLPS